MAPDLDALIHDQNIKQASHLVISVVTYDDGVTSTNVYDMESNRSMSVEEAIGILESVKYVLLQSGTTHIDSISIGEDEEDPEADE